ncbi:MAG: hypothetical protein V3S39_06570, partial [Thermodesulfobacteriota bacterium]
LIRKIRNDFAHSGRIESFSKSPIKDRCLELDVTKFATDGELCDPRKPEEKFAAAIGFLLLVLIHRREQLKRREEAQPITEDYINSLCLKAGKNVV